MGQIFKYVKRISYHISYNYRFMASTCVLFYPQKTARQKAVKIGCYLGDISAVIFVVEIIQKYFS